MSFNPLKLLDLCKSLCKGIGSLDSETISRTIISRAYYATFLHAREYLKEKHNVRFTRSGDDHRLVENQLMRKVDRHLGSVVRTLRENRIAADYSLSNPAIAHPQLRYGYRSLRFDQRAQKENIRLAQYVTNSLPRN